MRMDTYTIGDGSVTVTQTSPGSVTVAVFNQPEARIVARDALQLRMIGEAIRLAGMNGSAFVSAGEQASKKGPVCAS